MDKKNFNEQKKVDNLKIESTPKPNAVKRFFKNKYVNFTITMILFLLLVIWIGNYWLLLISLVIFDFYITKKVNWTFWKKRNAPRSRLIEWIDAAVFAVIAATIIRMFLIEAFTIPTSSMEKSLLVGDYLFVSKYHYGPRMPNTPISFPFAHHTLPFTDNTKSFLTWIQNPYKRLAGLEDIENDDVVVFNFPDGDTVCLNQQNQSYYQLCRDFGRKAVWSNDLINPYTGEMLENYFGEIVARPVDKRENYIKRCVGIHGDTLKVIDGILYVNNVQQKDIDKKQYKYIVITDGTPINPIVLEELEISVEDQESSKRIDTEILKFFPQTKGVDVSKIFIYPLIKDNAEELKKLPNVKHVIQIIKPKEYKETYIFPHSVAHYKLKEYDIQYIKNNISDSVANLIEPLKNVKYNNAATLEQALFKLTNNEQEKTLITNNKEIIIKAAEKDNYKWNEDNFGPIWVPEKGATIDITIDNLPVYQRIIDVFEENDLEIKGQDIYINGEKATTYTFKMDYYFMLGDSRHNSADSRFWGFVPEDHVVGKALFVWLSIDKDKSFLKSIRFDRFFKFIHD